MSDEMPMRNISADGQAVPQRKVDITIRFDQCEDFDFKAGGEGVGKCGIEAFNLKYASRFEIKNGKLIMEVAKDSRWLKQGSKRNAPYAVIEKLLAIDDLTPSKFEGQGILEIASVSGGEASPFLLFSDSVGVPGDGNSQVFMAYGGGVSVGELYAGERIGKITGLGESNRRPLKLLEAKLDREKANVTATFTEGAPMTWEQVGATQLACWADYGVKRDRPIRMCFGLSGGTYSQASELMEISSVSFNASVE